MVTLSHAVRRMVSQVSYLTLQPILFQRRLLCLCHPEPTSRKVFLSGSCLPTFFASSLAWPRKPDGSSSLYVLVGRKLLFSPFSLPLPLVTIDTLLQSSRARDIKLCHTTVYARAAPTTLKEVLTVLH